MDIGAIHRDRTGDLRAVILSGGGARGAYEAGVLSVVLGCVARERGARIDLLCGTSVGAIHAAILASALDDPLRAARLLEDAWLDLDIDNLLHIWPWHPGRLRRVLLGGKHPASLFDGRPLARLVERVVDRAAIAGHLRSGRLRGLTVTATHVPTGRPTIFVDLAPQVPLPTYLGRRTRVHPTRIAGEHVLASAAIPLLFPPLRVEGELYCDGGLRMNTPLGPAIRLGAQRVLVIGLSTTREDTGEIGTTRYPGAAFLLGKVLNAFLLDHVVADLEELEHVNRLLARVEGAAGPEVIARLGEGVEGAPGFQHVDTCVVRPSEDLGVVATQHLRALGYRPRTATLLRLLEGGAGASDLASYLMFDRGYTRALFELGREDARSRAQEIGSFLSA